MRLIPFASALGAALVFGAGCVGSAAADSGPLDGRTFTSVRVDGDPIPGGGPLTVGFDGGRISAHAGCNRAFGPVDTAGGVLLTPHLATTMMACPPPLDGADNWLIALFDAHPRWTLAGDTLTLYTPAATVTLESQPS